MLALKASSDFQRVARQGRKWTGSAFIMQLLNTEDTSPFRIGLTVSRRVGNAVVRNRAKRRLREIARLVEKEGGLKSCDVVLIAKTAAATMDFALMTAEFRKGLAALGMRA